jgi:UrcA family protein
MKIQYLIVASFMAVTTLTISTTGHTSVVTQGDRVTVRIKSADLRNLRSAKEVYAKLRATADQECHVNRVAQTVERKRAAQHCADDLLDQLVTSTNNSNLDQVHKLYAGG